MFSTLLGTVIVLWLGALVFYIADRLLKPQDHGIAETVVLALGLIFFLGMHGTIGQPILLGAFGGEQAGLVSVSALLADPAAWWLTLILLLSALATSLAGLGRPPAGRAGRLAALGAAVMLLMSGDWSMLALSWVLADLCLILAWKRDDQPGENWPRAGLLSLAGAVLLGVGLTLWQQGGSPIPLDPSRATSAPPGDPAQAAPWLIAAAWLRLMPFPLQSWLPSAGSADQTHPLTRLLAWLVPLVGGVNVWLRLARWDLLALYGGWLTILVIIGGIGALTAACKAWAAPDPQRLVKAACQWGGTLILATASLPMSAEWLLAAGIHIAASLTALSLAWPCSYRFEMADFRSYWRVIPVALPVLSLAGLPLTLGFAVRAAFYVATFQAQNWLLLLLWMVAESSILGALLRLVLDLEIEPGVRAAIPSGQNEPAPATPNQSLAGWLRQTVWPFLRRVDWSLEILWAGGAVLSLILVLLGLFGGLLRVEQPLPGLGRLLSLPTLPVWAALLLPVVGAAVLYRRQTAILMWAEAWWPLIQRIVELDWAYRLVEKGLRQVNTWMWGINQVVQGAGYMAWAMLICLIVLLLIRTR